MGFFSKLQEGLSKTKNSFDEKINNVFSQFRKVDEELLEELEEALIMSDVGMDTSLEIISNLRDRIKKENLYFAVVNVKGAKSLHMVLLYLENKSSTPLVMDNLSSKVIPLNQRKDLIPKFAFNEID